MAEEGRALALEERCDAVVALGGGSAIDAGKAIAALTGTDGEILDYMEVVGRGLPLPRAGIPCIAIPTTAGTGAEVTRNSSFSSPATRVKASLRSPYILPVLALVDPDLLDGMPPAVLAASGLDAFSHLTESFVSHRATPFTLSLAREGIPRIVRSLRRAYEHGLDPHSREDLALASMLGGFCLANSGLGAIHGFASPLGGIWNVAHGVACAALLPAVMRKNRDALALRAPDSLLHRRYRELDALLGKQDDATPWIAELVRDLGIPSLSALGLRIEELPQLVEKAKVASSMRGNPIVLTDEELTEILRCSF
jgi:alcohol dehydrogenase class IV